MTGKLKIAVVTGATRGIGKAVAFGLCEAGYTVVFVGRRLDTLRTLVAQIPDGRACAVQADVAHPEQVRELFAEVERRYGHIDLLFNNAGGAAPAVDIDALSDSDWQAVIQTNLSGAFYCAREAVRLMKKQTPRGGRIINNGSVSAHAPRPNSAPYTASKHALTGLTKSLSLDGRAYNIACGQIDIGNAGTDLAAAIKRGVPQADGSIRCEPVIDLAQVVEAVLFMAGLPLEANVQFMTLMATNMPFIGRG